MQTSRFSIQPDYQYTDDGRRRLAGYRVVHALTVTYRDLDTVGEPPSTRCPKPAAMRLLFTISHSRTPTRNGIVEAARRDAVDKLHRTARQLAEAASRELGPLLEISEGVAPPNDPLPATGHERVAESRSGRHPDQYQQRRHHRYRAWRVRPALTEWRNDE